MPKKYPPPDVIRQSILDRAAEFSKITGKSLTKVAEEAAGDGAFLTRVKGGGNFGIELYARFHKHLDSNWPKKPKAKAA